MKNQRKYTEDILFNNYMVSGFGEEYVHSQIPFYIEKDICNKMKFFSEEINKISLRVLENINGDHKRLLEFFEDFPLKEKIFNLKNPLSPMYWTRYDTFIDKENKVYFAEFNYDKPCGQKEINLAEKCEFDGNLNKNFIENLIEELLEISKEYSKSVGKVNVGFLMDPCHYEELHHAYYFKDIFKDTNINVVQVGNNNLSVKDGYVYGYSEIKLDIILRLFPTEFFHEITNIEEILECFDKGNVVIINDPRIIAIQSKGFFAYLWELVQSNSNLLNEYEKEIVKSCIPYTEVLNKDNIDKALKYKDRYVVKSSLGRYSQEVYIGMSYESYAWEEQLRLVLENKKIHILQDLINIREEYTYAPDYNNTNIPTVAYGNFGVYIMKKKVTGFLVRWSSEFLTDDNYTWMSPLGEVDNLLKIDSFINEDKIREDFYDYLNEELSFKYNFTGAYSNCMEYISLDKMIIKKDLYEEMKKSSSMFCKILNKVYPSIQENIELFGPILGIPKSLYKIVSSSIVKEVCAIGRIDFAIDNEKSLKILEFNSETPAGIVESIGVNSILKEKFNFDLYNPNENLMEDIKDNLKNILEELKINKDIKNIAVVTSWYYEDIYNTRIVSEILKELNEYNIIFGNVYDLKVKDKKLYLYEQEIQAIYRYFPLDWFYYEEEMKPLIDSINLEEYLINPGHTLITQSKAFFAVLYELIGKGILNEEEEMFIQKYIPYTTLEKDKILSHDNLAKPLLSREGDGIIIDNSKIQEDENYIYQDRVNIIPLRFKEYLAIKNNFDSYSEKFQFPIIGGYITNDKMSGIYTRMGDIITDKNAKYISSYIK